MATFDFNKFTSIFNRHSVVFSCDNGSEKSMQQWFTGLAVEGGKVLLFRRLRGRTYCNVCNSPCVALVTPAVQHL